MLARACVHEENQGCVTRPFIIMYGPKIYKYGKNLWTVPSCPYRTAYHLPYFHNPVQNCLRQVSSFVQTQPNSGTKKLCWTNQQQRAGTRPSGTAPGVPSIPLAAQDTRSSAGKLSKTVLEGLLVGTTCRE